MFQYKRSYLCALVGVLIHCLYEMNGATIKLFKIVQEYRALCTNIAGGSTGYSAARPQCKTNTLLLFHGKIFSFFYIADSDT